MNTKDNSPVSPADKQAQIMELLKQSDPETQRLALALAIGLRVVDQMDDITKAISLLKSVFPR
jgi:hypothetical protein